MALTNFYKGPEAEYSREKHINGIYMSTDSRKLWIFGQPTQELSDICLLYTSPSPRDA